MDQRELPSDSDESDEDYVPSGAESNPPSEEESDGNEDANEDPSDEEPEEKGKRKRSSKKLKNKTAKRVRRNKLDPKNKAEEEEVREPPEEKNLLTEEEEKKKADSLWSDFLKDTGSVPKTKKESSLPNGKSDGESAVPKQEETKERENKVTITKVYEFAGEEVKVTKEVPVDSVEAKTAAVTKPQSTSLPSLPAAGRGQAKARGGLSSVLGMIGNKKQKLGTLEKSKLDWDRFKKAEGIEEELQTHNRGRDGYLDKLDFLQRTDLRQFELEKQLRTSRRSNR